MFKSKNCLNAKMIKFLKNNQIKMFIISIKRTKNKNIKQKIRRKPAKQKILRRNLKEKNLHKSEENRTKKRKTTY
jgi:hypothetical protein